MNASMLVDGREFMKGRRTGIGRFLEGLLLAIHEQHPDWRLTVAMHKQCVLPASLDGKVAELYLPHLPELFWPSLAKGQDLFLSPYPKLPLLHLPCPAVHTVHDVFYLTHPACRKNRLRTMIARWLLRRSISKAALTWFVSQASQQACEALVGEVQHAAVRYSPVEPCFSPSDEKIPLIVPYFLCVGNGMPHKNVEVLLKAIQGTELKLKCVGVSEQAEKRIMDSSPDVKNQVEFMTGVDDEHLLELYRRATALLLPSLEEGYGFPPLEAMASGTPAIVSDIPVLRESTGGKAIYCPPHDAAAWRRAMLSMQDPEQRHACRQQVLEWIPCRQGKDGWRDHISDIEVIMGDC
ncbi:MAG: glycosyltransferase family 4 protein [Mariprofundaceae bacterium]|nr:glycosyltransferase family 4 protein [Mariprofundaceae bacterium]